MNGASARPPVVSAIVLAAGASTRMGRPKQLLPWGGVPMVRHVAETFARSMASEVIVVVGCFADEVARAVLGDEQGACGHWGECEVDDGRRSPIRVAVNDAWEDGMATSAARGARAARADAEAFLIALSDHPAVGVDVVNALITAFAERPSAGRSQAVMAPVHAGRRGHPVLFAAGLRAELESLGAGRTLRDIVNAYTGPAWSLVEVTSEGIRIDLDTWSDYTDARSRMPELTSCREEPEGNANGD